MGENNEPLEVISGLQSQTYSNQARPHPKHMIALKGVDLLEFEQLV